MARQARILHRIYFPEFRPFYDPFEHYLATWYEQMRGYKVMLWNSSNLNVNANEWTRRAYSEKAPVFLSEYFRWKVLEEYGGVYLDADCEVLNGAILNRLVEELYSQDEYDAFFGVEEASNGYPTAQTIGAKRGAEIVKFMRNFYDAYLSGPLWHWRETRGLIGPQLMSLFFLDKKINEADKGFIRNLEKPTILSRCKIYPQSYFSPKFTLLGDALDYNEEETCVYHMFANMNVDFSLKPLHEAARKNPLTFNEYKAALEKAKAFPRHYDGMAFETKSGRREGPSIVSVEPRGVLSYGPYLSLQRGFYRVIFNWHAEAVGGSMVFNATANIGVRFMARVSVDVDHLGDIKTALDFYIEDDLVKNIEFVVDTQNVRKVRLESVVLHRLENPPNPLKILHRIYFGFDGQPDPFMRYLKTWEEQLPDFTIMHWNASNLPMDSNEYVRELYQKKDHAFLSDYFRWYVLREHGGVYLDADVEIVNGRLFAQLVDELNAATKFDAFIGIDEASGGWYTAHSMASKPRSDITRFMCEVYEGLKNFTTWQKKGFYFWAPQMTALYFSRMGHHVAGMGTSPRLTGPIVAARVKIYSQDWFSPISPTGREAEPFKIDAVSENTCLCHHFACTWHDDDSIYIEAAKISGGQSGLMLRERMDLDRKKRFLAGSSKLDTMLGERESGKIVTTGRSGFLTYGPYIFLSAGRYDLSFGIEDVQVWEDVSIDLASNCGDIGLGERKVSRDEALTGRIHFEFSCASPCSEFECRLHVDEKSSFAVTDLVIDRLS